MISQGAAAVTARRRRWESWPLSYSGDNSEESKEQGDVSRSFKERWTSFKICLVLSSSGHKERVSDQSLAEYHLLSSEEDTRDELHKKKHNRAKVHQLPKQMGHRQSRQNWLIFFLSFFFLLSAVLPSQLEFTRWKTKHLPKVPKNLFSSWRLFISECQKSGFLRRFKRVVKLWNLYFVFCFSSRNLQVYSSRPTRSMINIHISYLEFNIDIFTTTNNYM